MEGAVIENEQEEDYDTESEDDVVDETKIRLKVPADVHVNMDTSLGRTEKVALRTPPTLLSAPTPPTTLCYSEDASQKIHKFVSVSVK